MFCVAAPRSLPNLRYALTMIRKGRGANAINNTFSSQILNMGVGLGLPLMIRGMELNEGVLIPSSKLVANAAIALAIGSVIFIGMTLFPAIERKEADCTITKENGRVLVFMTIAILTVYVVVSLILHFSVWLYQNHAFSYNKVKSRANK